MTTNKRGLDRASALAQATHLLAGSAAGTARLFLSGNVLGDAPHGLVAPGASEVAAVIVGESGRHAVFFAGGCTITPDPSYFNRTPDGPPTTAVQRMTVPMESARRLAVAGGHVDSTGTCALNGRPHSRLNTEREARIPFPVQKSYAAALPCSEVTTQPACDHSVSGTAVWDILGGGVGSIGWTMLEPGYVLDDWPAGTFVPEGTSLVQGSLVSESAPPSMALKHWIGCTPPHLIGGNLFPMKFTDPQSVVDLATHVSGPSRFVGWACEAVDLLSQRDDGPNGPEANIAQAKLAAEVISLFPEHGNTRAKSAAGISGEELGSGHRVAGVRERVVARLSAALGELTLDDTPVEWALLQKSLGAAYLEAEGGERPEAIELAIRCFEATLAVAAAQPDLREMAAVTYGELAAAYRERVAGDRAENLERALKCLDESFKTGVQAGDERLGIFDKQSAWDAL